MLTAAQVDVEASLARLRQDGRGLANGEAQLQGLSSLQQRVAFADARQLLAMRNEVMAVAAATQLVASQTRPATDGLDAATAAEKARRALFDLVDDYYDRKKFDPYLRFASAEDEAAFRKREAERKAAIDAARAEGTPEGNARAARLMKEQMVDAGAHGADRSPEYAEKLQSITQSSATLDAAVRADNAEKATPTTDPMAALRAAGVTVADGSAKAAAPAGAGTGRSLG